MWQHSNHLFTCGRGPYRTYRRRLNRSTRRFLPGRLNSELEAEYGVNYGLITTIGPSCATRSNNFNSKKRVPNKSFIIFRAVHAASRRICAHRVFVPGPRAGCATLGASASKPDSGLLAPQSQCRPGPAPPPAGARDASQASALGGAVPAGRSHRSPARRHPKPRLSRAVGACACPCCCCPANQSNRQPADQGNRQARGSESPRRRRRCLPAGHDSRVPPLASHGTRLCG